MILNLVYEFLLAIEIYVKNDPMHDAFLMIINNMGPTL